MRKQRTRPNISDYQRSVFDSRFIVDERTGCWNWTGPFNGKQGGYGQYSIGAMPYRIHQLSYWFHVGDIPPGHEIDHLCRNRTCGNPDHLEAVTHAENMARAKAAKTACGRGHPYNEENTRYFRRRRPNGQISERRSCRLCHRIYDQARRKKGVA